MRLSRPIPEFLQISAERAYTCPMNAATISELVLVAACGIAGRTCKSLPGLAGRLAPASFFLVGLAAFAGALRYSGLELVTPIHERLSPLAAIGLSALGGCFLALRHPQPRVGYITYGLIVLGGLSCMMLEPNLPWRLVLSLIGIGLIVSTAALTLPRSRSAASASLAAATALVLVGLGIGTEGSLWGFPRLDLFHLGMAATMALYAIALRLTAAIKS